MEKHSWNTCDWKFSRQWSEFYNQNFYLGSSKWSSYEQKNMKNLQNIILSNLILEVIQYQICEGGYNAKIF